MSRPTPVGLTRAFDTNCICYIHVGLNRVYDVYIAYTFPGVDPTDSVGLSRALDTNCIYDIRVGLNRNYDVYIVRVQPPGCPYRPRSG